ncbi:MULTISPECIES: flagellar protein export ATPase FliI [Eubacteriales]|jgi:flagellum-specific ATP synthase|uniref:flagellar protein export ATPase FliI n=1 Tax=Eubacteriales TaxID=186802 RepID=UPI001368F873|nr:MULTISPECIES: flagellar protein export ATPase FliI [unclassified Neglectibacter]MCI8395719.1 flagellar protein export ATPase FliI [Acutalibacter sp.]MCI8921072.1 flagellar protein export ATPase FliI [Acutalibacter sp.]MCI9115981.1 flagellar protein export ATPase FliI [Acutalibacter sp.]NBI17402.1 flagellar protein export ATPase FliI [Neglectibacter sp. 59]NBJ73947.1 flagellar protein export ATPase FliI [Neglectibacter sp. X4]
MFQDTIRRVQQAETIGHTGKIENIVGMSIEASGSRAAVGDICRIYSGESGGQIPAEVVGFKNDRILLMPYSEMTGISSGNFVRNTGHQLRMRVGPFLKGRIINALGQPIDDMGAFEGGDSYCIGSSYINPLSRPPIRERMEFGVKAIDGLLTIGKGQRMGIFAGSGVGKSTLLGMIAKNVKADINVIALVGERGREVLEFVQKDLGEEGMARSVLVVATSDQPAMLRMKCPSVATGIAEYFRDQGYDVLLMMDSLTRFAMAQREIGLAIGEPPVARGYTPSIYAELPKLLERSGNFKRGSITAIYTVLVEGDDTNEPIADTVRGILDGHIVLSRQLAAQNHYPAIDIGASISRLMVEIVDTEHQRLASRLRDILSIYNQNADLVSIGAYKAGTNQKLDFALTKIDEINGFLMQGTKEVFNYEQCLAELHKILQ